MRRILLLMVIMSFFMIGQAQSEDIDARLVTFVQAGAENTLMLLEDGELVPIFEDYSVSPGEWLSLSWSADCNLLAVTVDSTPDDELSANAVYLLDFMTGEYTRVASDPISDLFNVTLSPDGARLYYVTTGGEGMTDPSFIVDLESRTHVQFWMPGESRGRTSWMADSSGFVTDYTISGERHLFWLDFASDEERINWEAIYTTQRSITDFDITGDGREVVFIEGAGASASRLYHLDVASEDVTPLTLDSGQRAFLELSADGQMIAYNEGKDVFIMAIDGSDVQNLTNGQFDGSSPAYILGWTDDGHYVLFYGALNGNSLVHNVYAIAVDGSEFIQLSDVPIVDGVANTWHGCFPVEE